VRTSQKSANRLATVPSSTAKLVEQFLGRPRRLAAGIPVGQRMQSLVIIQRKTTYEPAADAERVNIAVLARNSGRH
jgi:hypothetical protein